MTDDDIDYSDRPTACPACGNENLGHTRQTSYCKTDPDDEQVGCGWLQVYNGGIDMRNRVIKDVP